MKLNKIVIDFAEIDKDTKLPVSFDFFSKANEWIYRNCYDTEYEKYKGYTKVYFRISCIEPVFSYSGRLEYMNEPPHRILEHRIEKDIKYMLDNELLKYCSTLYLFLQLLKGEQQK